MKSNDPDKPTHIMLTKKQKIVDVKVPCSCFHTEYHCTEYSYSYAEKLRVNNERQRYALVVTMRKNQTEEMSVSLFFSVSELLNYVKARLMEHCQFSGGSRVAPANSFWEEVIGTFPIVKYYIDKSGFCHESVRP